jgi:hypothetical protein
MAMKPNSPLVLEEKPCSTFVGDVGQIGVDVASRSAAPVVFEPAAYRVDAPRQFDVDTSSFQAVQLVHGKILSVNGAKLGSVFIADSSGKSEM